MFITEDALLSPASALLCGKGQRGWLAAELALQQNWFLACFEQTEGNESDGISFLRTMMFTDFKAIEQLIDASVEGNFNLKSVHILTPNHVNGTDTWKMDQIGAVWLGREPHAEYFPMDIFETTSGEKYPAFNSGKTIDQLQIDALKFKFDA